jgi:hypothetical protein
MDGFQEAILDHDRVLRLDHETYKKAISKQMQLRLFLHIYVNYVSFKYFGK